MKTKCHVPLVDFLMQGGVLFIHSSNWLEQLLM